MRKKILTLSITFLLLLFGVFALTNNHVKANEGNVTVAFTIVKTDVETHTGSFSGQLGSEVTIDAGELGEIDFVILNGSIVEDISFKVTRSNKIIAVLKGAPTVYIDTNGDFVGAGDQEPEKAISKPGFKHVGYRDLDSSEKVKVANYSLAEGTIIDVFVDGGEGTDEYTYNSIVSLTTTNPDFSYWADEDGQVVSTNPNYKFTALKETILEAVAGDPVNEDIIYLTNVSGIRPDSKSFLGHIDNKKGLIEWGLIASNKQEILELDTLDAEVFYSKSLNTVTNEFLVTVADTKDFTTFRAFARYEDKVVYSENVFLEIPEKEGSEQTVTETFANSSATDSYADGSFVGLNNITWTYGHSRDEDTFVIDGKGIMLRRASDSYLEATFPNGLISISFQYRKAYTGSAERQLELIVNGEQEGTTDMFGSESGEDATIYTFSKAINISEAVTVRIKNVGTATTNKQITIDNIIWTTGTTATPATSTKIYGVTFENGVESETRVVHKDDFVTLPLEPELPGYTFEGWFIKDTETEFDSNTPITSHLEVEARFEKIPMDTISQVLDKIGDEVVFEGVISGFTEFSTQYGNYDKVWIEDETGAITIYRATSEQSLQVGDKYLVNGTVETSNGLIRIAQGANLELVDSNNELLPATTITDLADLTNSMQAKRININEATVVSVSSNGQEMTVSLEGEEILLRAISASGDINNHLLTAIVNQKVNLKNIHVDFYNDFQLLPISIEQIELVAIPDSELIVLAGDALVDDFDGKVYNMDTTIELPTEGLHGVSIAWTLNPADAITEGKWKVVEADTDVTLTATLTLGEETSSVDMTITIKFVDTETPIEKIVLDSETFLGKGSLPIGWSHSGLGSDYSGGNPRLKFDTTGDTLTTPSFTLLTDAVISIYVRNNGMSGAFKLELLDQNNNVIHTFTTGFPKQNNNGWLEFEIIDTSVTQITLKYTKATGNLGVGQIKIEHNLNP